MQTSAERPRWVINELAHAGNEHLDEQYVVGYDRKAGSDPTADVAEFCDLGLSETSIVVDVGAGTGTFALAVAPFCKRVVAVDVSPAMVRHLEAKAQELGIMNVEPVLAGFLSYEHDGPLADFVYSRNGLHHLPDFFKVIALRRMVDMMNPGGVLLLRDLVYSFDPGEVEGRIEAWLLGATDDPKRGWTAVELETHVREEYSTFSWLLEPMLNRVGFEIKRVEHWAGTYAAYLCVKKKT